MKSEKRLFLKYIPFIQGAILIFSLSGVCQKMASSYDLNSWKFFLYYGLSIAVLFLYALFWQIILKKVPLTVAYSNRAISTVWSLVWGVVLFQERLNWTHFVGAFIICAGVFIITTEGEKDTPVENGGKENTHG